MIKQIKRYSTVMIGLFSLVVSPMLWASPVTLTLKSIEKIRASEPSGDELYFAVTVYSSNEKPAHSVFPQLPQYWSSNHLSQVKDVVLWQRELQPDEAIEIILSLIDHDLPPWDLDDLIGTIKVKFKKEGNHLVSEWRAMAPRALQSKPYGKQDYQFDLEGDNSDYRIVLNLKA